MTAGVNLSDALIQVERAKQHYGELMRVFSEWTESGGIRLQTVHDPAVVRYSWEVAVHTMPSQNLPGLAGDVIGDLWKALDYTASAIYRAARGGSDGGKAGSVAFPMLADEPDDWDATVKAKVPGCWPEASDALKASQPFTQQGEEAHALPVLQGLGRTDKHRNLNLCAAAAYQGSAIWPDAGQLPVGVSIFLDRADGEIDKGPVILIEPGVAVEVASACVNAPHAGDDAVYLWTSGIQFDEPPAPHVEFGFRANNGSEATLAGLAGLIAHVEVIADRFTGLQAPD